MTLSSFNYSKDDCVYIETYETTNSCVKATIDLENKNFDTVKLLKQLGMGEDFIFGLSKESLNEFAKAKSIMSVTTTSSFEQDDFNPLARKAIIDETYFGEGEVASGNKYVSNFEDDHMRITYIVAYLGNREYKFSMDAEWLTMPIFRFTDSFGAISMNMTVINNSRSGWYSYDESIYTLINTTKNTIKCEISQSNMYNAVDGNWYGSACEVDLPSSTYTDYTSISITNYKVHYEFNGHYNGEVGTYFNTIASYDHAEISIKLSDSLNISTAGGSFGIGLSIILSHTKRSAEYESDILYKG